MKTSVVVTLIGADRPGLVSAVAARASACGANWMESSMARLAGHFAGIVRLQIDAAAVDALEAALRELEAEGLRLSVARGDEAEDARGTLRLALLGQDRPGIVRDISAVLARRGASIERIETATASAPFSGEAMFRAQLDVHLPTDVSAAEVRRDLEALANELMVDLRFGAADEVAGDGSAGAA